MSTAVSMPPAFGLPADDDGPSRPAPRRTYGKRAVTPVEDDTPVRSVFTAVTTESPSKTLLNRWSDNGNTWRASLAGLGSDPAEASTLDAPTAGPSRMRPKLTDFAKPVAGQLEVASTEEDKDADEDEDDMEEIKKHMEKMRRLARGLPLNAEKETSLDKQLPGPVISSEPAVVSEQRRLAAFSSTLTSLPPSDGLISDPPSPRASSFERSSTVEVVPIPKNRKGIQPANRAIGMSGSEEDEYDASSQPAPQRRSRQPSPIPKLKSSSPSAFDGEDGNVGDVLDQFWAELADQREDDPEALSPVEKPSPADGKQVEPEAAGLFDSDDEAAKKTPTPKGKKPKALSKKDFRAMQSGLAENRRNRAVEVHKVSGHYLPMSSYMLDAIKVVNAKADVKPLNLRAKSSPKTSPSRATARDDIVAFTPSSDHADQRTATELNSSTVAFDETPSSPTPGASRAERASTIVPGTSDGADADSDGDVDDMVNSNSTEDAKRRVEEQQKKERIKALAAKKEAQLRLLSSAKKVSVAEDDDIEIVKDELSEKSKMKFEIGRRASQKGPEARAVLDRFGGSSSPHITRHKQIVMRHAGKSGRSKDSLTETFVDFAGKAFNHPGMKRSNGGAMPAGLKKNRESVINQAQLDAMMRRQHLEQAEKVRRQKEEAYGRTKMIPAKQEPDFEAIIAASAAENPHDAESEDEDDDFEPDDDEDDFAGEADDDQIQYSGDEDNQDEDSGESIAENNEEVTTDEGQPEDVVMDSADKQAEPSVEAEEVPIDTEEVTPRPVRFQMSNASSAASTLQSASQLLVQSGGADGGLGGLESDDGGFSQLFEPTQVSGDPVAVDAFAGLRHTPANLLQADVFLPDNDVTETQAARDNALIAGEIEAAIETQPGSLTQRKLYMNEDGKLTQTKPASNDWSSFRQKLGGPSDLLSDIAESPGPMTLSSTEKGTSEVTPRTSSLTYSPGMRSVLQQDGSPEADSSRGLLFHKRHEEDINARLMRQARRAEAKKAAVKSNLIDNQAEESDEDGGWAVNGVGDDEDDEGQDDGFVPDLVNDEAIDEEERKKQDLLAAAKLREVEQADDAKREAEARKVIEGQYRNKKRGADFFSDEEDDEEGGKRRRWSKKERRKRRLDREDGLEKLEGEENAFKAHYEAGLDSDYSDDEPESMMPVDLPPIEESIEDSRPTWMILRERAKKNKGRDLSRQDEDLDRELGLDDGGIQQGLDDEELVVESESQFSISRSVRSSTSIVLDQTHGTRTITVQRSTDSYAQFVRDESQVNRRLAGAAGVSVVVKKSTGLTGSRITGSAPRAPSRQSTTSSTGSGSVLLERKNRFQN